MKNINERLSSDQLTELKDVALCVGNFLKRNCHPHITAIITATSVELVEGIANIPDLSSWQSKGDIKEAVIHLDKISDTEYKPYIRIVFYDGGILHTDEAMNPANWLLSEFLDVEALPVIELEKIEVLKGAVALYPKAFDTRKVYSLTIVKDRLCYRHGGSFVRGGTCFVASVSDKAEGGTT